jgi:hypothetical protein
MCRVPVRGNQRVGLWQRSWERCGHRGVSDRKDRNFDPETEFEPLERAESPIVELFRVLLLISNRGESSFL